MIYILLMRADRLQETVGLIRDLCMGCPENVHSVQKSCPVSSTPGVNLEEI